jgi:uncharacterized protein GlcG (DUF336 family)
MKKLGLVAGAAFIAVTCAAIAFAQTAPRIDPNALEDACAAAAKIEPAQFRPKTHFTKMWCAVINREGQLLAIKATDTGGTPTAPAGSDAWRGSIEIAIAKAYTAVAFSSNELNVDSRAIGLLSRRDGPGMKAPSDIGHDDGVAPLWGIGNSNPFRPPLGSGLGTDDVPGGFHHGIITFAGGQPVYSKGQSGCDGGVLLGAVGVSGDGVDEDDEVATKAVTNAGFCLTP